jgi:hypothetical protein
MRAPLPAHVIACRTTIVATALGRAPTATRMPISRVRALRVPEILTLTFPAILAP